MTEGQIPPPHGSDDQKTTANQFQASNFLSSPKPSLGRVCSLATFILLQQACMKEVFSEEI